MVPSKENRALYFFYLLFIIYLWKNATYCLVFFRLLRVESWNPEYPYVITPILLHEKRMSFLLLTLVVSLEVELKPPCYKEATSHVQQ